MSKLKVENSQLEISAVLKRLIAEMFSLSKLQGHTKVESLLITAFEKFYNDRLLKIDDSGPQTMVEEVKKLGIQLGDPAVPREVGKGARAGWSPPARTWRSLDRSGRPV